jgi:hypothetical protein
MLSTYAALKNMGTGFNHYFPVAGRIVFACRKIERINTAFIPQDEYLLYKLPAGIVDFHIYGMAFGQLLFPVFKY